MSFQEAFFSFVALLFILPHFSQPFLSNLLYKHYGKEGSNICTQSTCIIITTVSNAIDSHMFFCAPIALIPTECYIVMMWGF